MVGGHILPFPIDFCCYPYKTCTAVLICDLVVSVISNCHAMAC